MNESLNGAEERLDEVVRLLAVLVRRESETQADAILDLHRAGFQPRRIAELLGTTPGTASVTINRAKKRKGTGRAEDRG